MKLLRTVVKKAHRFRKKSAASRPARSYPKGELDRSRAVTPVKTMEALRRWALPNSWCSNEWDKIKAHIAAMQLAVGGGEDVTFFYDAAAADPRISERGREFIFNGMLEILKRDMDFQASRPRPDVDAALASFSEMLTTTEDEREMFMRELDAELAEEERAFKRAQGVPVQVFPPNFVEWLGMAQEILNTNDVEIPDETEITVPESTAEFFDLLFSEAGLESDNISQSTLYTGQGGDYNRSTCG